MNAASGCLLLVCILTTTASSSANTDWQAEFNRLSRLIEERKGEPADYPKLVEPYLQWMEIKARDRDQVKALVEELNRQSFLKPEDKELAGWTQRFFELLRKAEESGNATVAGACIMILRCGYQTRNNNWQLALDVVQDDARRIYSKAAETEFNTHWPQARARCMINFIIGDIEYGHLAIWYGRQGVFGFFGPDGFHKLPDREFEQDCERRIDFTLTEKGEPREPVDEAFAKVRKIREEADWWGFAGESSDAKELMNNYYEDALCKVPPHRDKMGHDWFKDRAEEHSLERSVEHNEEFHATLYGTVELKEPGGKSPAPGAMVTLRDGQRTWTAKADAQGRYEIKDAILHKECSPFKISAEYKRDRVDDTYDGILTAPDRNARQRKDLLIVPSPPADWSGRITYEQTQSQTATGAVPGGGGNVSMSLNSGLNVTFGVSLKLTRVRPHAAGKDNVHDAIVAFSGNYSLSYRKTDTTEFPGGDTMQTVHNCNASAPLAAAGGEAGGEAAASVVLVVNEAAGTYRLQASLSRLKCTGTSVTTKKGIEVMRLPFEWAEHPLPLDFEGAARGGAISGAKPVQFQRGSGQWTWNLSQLR